MGHIKKLSLLVICISTRTFFPPPHQSAPESQVLDLSGNAALGFEAGVALQQLCSENPRIVSVGLSRTAVPPDLQSAIAAQCLTNLTSLTMGYCEWQYVSAIAPQLVEGPGLLSAAAAELGDVLAPADAAGAAVADLFAPFVIDRVALRAAEFSVEDLMLDTIGTAAGPHDPAPGNNLFLRLLQFTHPNADAQCLLHCMQHYAGLYPESAVRMRPAASAELFRLLAAAAEGAEVLPLWSLCQALRGSDREELEHLMQAYFIDRDRCVSMKQFVLLMDRRLQPLVMDPSFMQRAACGLADRRGGWGLGLDPRWSKRRIAGVANATSPQVSPQKSRGGVRSFAGAWSGAF